jgi:hypothetical protein
MKILERHRAIAASVTATLALALIPATSGAAVANTAPSTDEPTLSGVRAATRPACWVKVKLPPNSGRGRLTDLVRVGRTTWAFGVAPGVSSARPTALRNSGGGWRATQVPLRGVSGLMGGDAEKGGATWAVGFRRPGVSMQPISMRWRNGRWVNVRVPDPPGPGASLADVEVLPSGRAWAVGTRLQGGRTRPYVVRWAGRWQRFEPKISAREAGLAAVTSDPGDRIWAVGWQLKAGGSKPLILRRSGAGWKTLDTSGLVDGQAVLTDIDFASADTAYASGFEMPTESVRYVPLLLRWNGTTWSRMALPWDGSMSALLHGVATGPKGALLLTGVRLALNGGRNRAFYARFQDRSWTVRLAPLNKSHNSELTDGEWIRGRPLAVGANATKSVLLKGCRNVAATSVRSSPPTTSTRTTTPKRLTAQRNAAVKPAKRVRFRDVAAKKGIREVTESWGLVAADFNGDGWTDVFLGRHNRLKPKLMMGGKKGFSRAGSKAFRLRDRHGCAAGDVNADGKPDLYCSIGANRGSNMTSNELWLKPGTRNRKQVTADYGVIDPFGRGRVATFFYLDDDPYPELYVANEPERVDGMPGFNRLYLNDGGTRYLSAPEQGADHSMGGSCATAGDIDGDGDEDLLVCASEGWGGLPAGVRVFRNVDGKLRHATKAVGLNPIHDVDIVVADFDGDGKADDVAQLGTGILRVSIGTKGGQKRVYQRSVSAGVGLAAGDVNADGRADLYVLRGGIGNKPDLLLLNRRKGRKFVSQRIPQTRVGVADDVVALDHDRNGLDDFLVTNGWQSRGPVQLIASFRR